jgi:MFS family permease
LGGIGGGIAIPIIFAYSIETIPKNHRGMVSMGLSSGSPLGYIYACLICYFYDPFDFDNFK